jgi:alpha,alpha-trehalase
MQIQDPKLRKWALELHGIWKDLCRTINEDVKNNPDMHSMQVLVTNFNLQVFSLWMEEPFIVPGGRFREPYYSDSYWIVKGLIVSDMIETAKSITRNFASLVYK